MPDQWRAKAIDFVGFFVNISHLELTSMPLKIKHTCKVVGQYRYGGIGLVADYMREVRLSARDEQGNEVGFVSATILKCLELIEDKGDQEFLITLLDSTRDHARLCRVIYGCAPLDLGEVAFAQGYEAFGEHMKEALAEFKVGQRISQLPAMDLLLITDAQLGIDQASLGIQLLHGLRQYFKDAEYVFVSPRIFSEGFSVIQSPDNGRLLETMERAKSLRMQAWRDFGFKSIGASDFLFCSANSYLGGISD